MPTIDNLNHQTIKGLTADGDYTEYWERDFPRGSFGVRVSGRTGKKKFVLRYYNRHGKKRRITIGEFANGSPAGISLAQARDKALKILGDVGQGKDPAEDQNSEGPDTMEQLIELFLDVHGEKISERTKTDYRNYFEKDILPRWADSSPGAITRSDVVEVLDHIAFERDAKTTSNRTRAALHKLFNFAVARGIVESNPVQGVPRRGTENSRDRVLDEEEIATLWSVLDDENPVTSHLFKTLLLTGQRLGETRTSRWEDLEDNTLIIPSDRAKNGRMNRVPLSTLAQEVLEDVKDVTGESDFIFCTPSPAKQNTPIKWLGDATKRIREKCGFYFVAHDLRRTCASGMSRLGTDRMTISKVLNHKSADNEITAVYDRYDREEEKRSALKGWSDHVSNLVRK